ncbi:MAG: hypothetical protein AAFR35_09320 [Pseudomonadota bacterium]
MFFRSEDGAVTADFVVITAVSVGMAAGAAAIIWAATGELAPEIADVVEHQLTDGGSDIPDYLFN